MTDPDQKEIIKQAINEWMDKQLSNLGRWIVTRFLITAFGSILVWYITTHGKSPF